jgi:GDPmannose 4,6-dehydratase
VTRKITRWLGKNLDTIRGLKHLCPELRARVSPPKLKLGNLEARRDWGHAADYVRAMWLMLQQEAPDDYVVATGETHSVREFMESAFAEVGLNPDDWVETDAALLRPCEVPYLRGDATKVRGLLGWGPKVTFGELVREMVLADLED